MLTISRESWMFIGEMDIINLEILSELFPRSFVNRSSLSCNYNSVIRKLEMNAIDWALNLKHFKPLKSATRKAHAIEITKSILFPFLPTQQKRNEILHNLYVCFWHISKNKSVCRINVELWNLGGKAIESSRKSLKAIADSFVGLWDFKALRKLFSHHE